MRALQVAVAAAHTDAGQEALWKLGGTLGDERPAVSVAIPNGPSSLRSAPPSLPGRRSGSGTGASSARSTPGACCCAGGSGT
jgi:hypothetical protein